MMYTILRSSIARMLLVGKAAFQLLILYLVLLYVPPALAGQPYGASAAAEDKSVPAGAEELGYRTLLFDIHPTESDISFSGTGNAPLYNGEWFARPPPPAELYSNQDGSLHLRRGGDLVTSSHDFTNGSLPLLSGKVGFYVEITYKVDNTAMANWPAIWLMPVEHDALKRDHLRDAENDLEQWMEIDIDEGGYGPGLTGTVHAWSGVWPHYHQVQNPNNIRKEPLNRTISHTYGASFTPKTSEVNWWLDNSRQMTAGAPFVPKIAINHHYYILISANSHDGATNYGMTVERIRAFGP